MRMLVAASKVTIDVCSVPHLSVFNARSPAAGPARSVRVIRLLRERQCLLDRKRRKQSLKSLRERGSPSSFEGFQIGSP